jgi:Ca2+/Na+ antiporter
MTDLPRGITQSWLVRAIAFAAILWWWWRTFDLMPAFGSALRRQFIFGFVAVVGLAYFVLDGTVNLWWFIPWLISLPLFVYYLWLARSLAPANDEWLASMAREAEFEAQVQQLVDEEIEYDLDYRAQLDYRVEQEAAKRLRQMRQDGRL